MCEGFNFKFKREYDLWLAQMKLVRWVGSLIYNSNVKKQNRMAPEKLFYLPEIEEKETKRKATIPTPEQMAEIRSWLK